MRKCSQDQDFVITNQEYFDYLIETFGTEEMCRCPLSDYSLYFAALKESPKLNQIWRVLIDQVSKKDTYQKNKVPVAEKKYLLDSIYSFISQASYHSQFTKDYAEQVKELALLDKLESFALDLKKYSYLLPPESLPIMKLEMPSIDTYYEYDTKTNEDILMIDESNRIPASTEFIADQLINKIKHERLKRQYSINIAKKTIKKANSKNAKVIVFVRILTNQFKFKFGKSLNGTVASITNAILKTNLSAAEVRDKLKQ